jgi:predicted RNA-binding Zn-ribbon protein involved in translation (DUF1610 family)
MPPEIEPIATTTPTRCPFCGSNSVGATGRKITPSTYWRCDKCGQLWHPERLRASWEFGGARR